MIQLNSLAQLMQAQLIQTQLIQLIQHEFYMLSRGITSQLLMITPYWITGLIAGSLISVYLSGKIAETILKLAADRLWVICLAAILGVASPLCMFGTVPLIAALGKKGVPQHILAAFMVSSVLLNPNLWLVSFVLGFEIVIIRLFLAIMAGILAGLLVLYSRMITCSLACGSKSNFSVFSFERFEVKDSKKKVFYLDLLKALRITAPYLLIGVTLTALGERYIPPEWIAGMFGNRRGLGVLFATTLSVPLYICGAGTVPLIRAWLFAGMGVGDAMAFMLAGPATKINNLSAVKMILTNKSFLFYLAYVICFAMLAGLLVGMIL